MMVCARFKELEGCECTAPRVQHDSTVKKNGSDLFPPNIQCALYIFKFLAARILTI